jgi:catechol 2,3-dioxygenase-like lactoylglutathione lyase family enzyme
MPHVRRFDHVGITVADLDAVTAFFAGLGPGVENRMFVEGEFLDTVIGIPGSRAEIVMLQPPDGGTRLELSSFARPDHLPGSPAAPANELGLRNVAFEVHDLQAVVNRVRLQFLFQPFRKRLHAYLLGGGHPGALYQRCG